MGCLGSRDNGGVGDKREVDARVGNQVCLELVQIDVEGSVKTKRSGDGGNDYMTSAHCMSSRKLRRLTLSDESVEVFVVGSLNSQVPTADIVNGFIIDHKAAVGVLKGSMSR